MNQERPFKRVCAATALAALVCVALGNQAYAGRPYVVSEGSSAGHIWRVEDANGDGDALDVGERTLWGEGFTGAYGMTADSRAVYVTEIELPVGSNQVVRLFDANSDGDALDVGERTIWLDGLDHPRDVSFDGSGTWYLSEFDDNQIWRLVDSNNDGDALDIGEKILFAQDVDGPQMSVTQGGGLLVAAALGGQIHRLVDLNGDGDALDVAENLAITPNYDQLGGLLDDGQSGFYFSSFATDTVYHAHDRNGDGDMLDVAEVLSYADYVYGLLDGPVGLTDFDGGGFLVADLFHNQLRRARDKNGDGDALDLGDVILYADGIDQPIDIVALPFGLPGDYNNDHHVDAVDYTVWRNNLGDPDEADLHFNGDGNSVSESDFSWWKQHYGNSDLPPGGGAFSAATPEPASVILFAIGLAGLIGLSAARRDEFGTYSNKRQQR